MSVLNLIPNTPEWHQHRRGNYNASEAASMLGIAKKGPSRSELVKIKATGVYPEIDPHTQRIFDKGHEYEAIARPWAEEIVGEELYPAIYADTIDGLPLSYSSDGVTMLEDVIFEHKSLNDTLRVALDQGVIPDEYHPQMEQGLLLTGAEKCLFMASSGNRDDMRFAWYEPNPELRARIIAGWKQFAIDVANYQPVEIEPPAVAASIDSLPALLVQVEGRVLATNLDQFKQAAMSFIDNIKTDLETDQDFADAEKTVKFCKEAEDKLELVKSQAIAQTASIDEVFRAMDDLREAMRAKRLALDKSVKSRKEAIRIKIVQEASAQFAEYLKTLNQRLGGAYMPPIKPPFGESIKGKKTLASCHDALGTAMANSKIEANEIADRIEINKNAMDPSDWALFPDFGQLCLKPSEDFARLIAARRESEQQRIQAAIRAKEAAERAAEEARKAREAAAEEAKARLALEAEAAEARKALEAERVARLAEEARKAQETAQNARQDVIAPEPANDATSAKELAQAAIAHEESKPSRLANKLRMEIGLSLSDLDEKQLMKVVEFVAGLVAERKKAA